MKRMAAMVVACESTVAAPRGPKAVCDPMPPNAPGQVSRLAALQQHDNDQEKRDDDMNDSEKGYHVQNSVLAAGRSDQACW